jgi:hypothetical protein
LRQFGPGESIEFSGALRIILEPGATIILSGGIVRFSGTTSIIAQPFEKSLQVFNTIAHANHSIVLDPFTATSATHLHHAYAPLIDNNLGLSITDAFRVKFIGTGTLECSQDACFFIPDDAFVGVETFYGQLNNHDEEISTTDLTFVLRDNAQFLLGDREVPGGVLQIGNAIYRKNHTINCSFSLQGNKALFALKSQAFLGLGVGIADKRSFFPNDWIVNTTFNVSKISIVISDGVFEHSRIFAGDDQNASLIALARYTNTTPSYCLYVEDMPTSSEMFKETSANILGGGNVAIISQDAPLLHPIVTNDAGHIPLGTDVHPRLRTGILASRSLMCTHNQCQDPDDFFDAIVMKDFQEPGKSLGKASVAFKDQMTRTLLRVAFVDRHKIARDDIYDLDDAERFVKQNRQEQAAQNGVLSIHVALSGMPPARILFAQQLPA